MFGIISAGIFAISPFLYYPCKSRYSKYFLPDKFCLYKNETVKYSEYYTWTYKYIIEEYNYENYPYLKEIDNIYYKNNTKERIEVKINYENISIIFFFLAVAAMPALSIISFILLICFKCKDKGHIGFIILEITLCATLISSNFNFDSL